MKNQYYIGLIDDSKLIVVGVVDAVSEDDARVRMFEWADLVYGHRDTYELCNIMRPGSYSLFKDELRTVDLVAYKKVS